ncbi:putative Polypyrimidine tract-binding protein [Blattamonas nauphoetae]|uniref:Polypyrimidine tract-binding protein n=1 Tax=Blattamonas nauphoetae TaxID=2049346 RepID=A0ABQ9XFS4_9EUKA|nr:putative Polypyrimidine tract-binding protein [Blattamonas nauphoetae]
MYNNPGPKPSRQFSGTPVPSKVIHLRNVPPTLSVPDLIRIGEQFGKVVSCSQLRHNSQFVMQFQDLPSATNFFKTYSQSGLLVQGATIYVTYSLRQSIAAPNPETSGHTHILHLTITNVQYDINVNVLSQIFNRFDTSPRKSVEKIVIFQKSDDVQALIQFTYPADAQNAKHHLHGKNIYSNCCTLSIEDSIAPNLDVRENSNKSVDYTNPNLPQGNDYHNYRGSLMTTPQQNPQSTFPGYARNPVLLVNRIPSDKIGCDQLFNLFSNYGTITCIKILFNKPETALIQFSDAEDAGRAVNALRNVPLFGSTLEVSVSRNAFIKNTQNPDNADPHTRNYDRQRNRSIKASANGQRNTASPSETLHVANLSNNTTEEQIVRHLGSQGAIEKVKVYDHAGKKMALVKFKNINEAVECMCMAHNTLLDEKSIKLTFTRNTI